MTPGRKRVIIAAAAGVVILTSVLVGAVFPGCTGSVETTSDDMDALRQVRPLVSRLKAPFPDTTREVTIHAKGSPDTTTARMPDAALYAALQHERMQLAFELVDIGRAGVPDLIKAVEDESWAHREYAAYVLGLIGDERAIKPLRKIMNSHREDQGGNPWNADIRQECAIALARMGRQDGLIYAMRCGRRNPSTGGVIFIHPPAFLPSQSWNYGTEIEPLLAAVGKPASQGLIACLGDESSRIRLRAAHLLGQMRDGQAVEPLIRLLADPDEGVASHAARALGKIGDRRAVEALLPIVVCKWHFASEAAAEALGKIGDARIVPKLAEAWRNGSWPTRMAAIKTIDRLGGPGAIAALKKMVTKEQEMGVYYVNVVAGAEALARRGDKGALDMILGPTASGPSGWYERGQAIKAIGRIPGPESERILLKQLANNMIRHIAATGLAERGRKEGFDALRLTATRRTGYSLGSSSDELRRMAALVSLAKIGGVMSLPLIRRALSEEPSYTRIEVVKALGNALRRDRRDLIEAALRDKDSGVRAVAAHALGELRLKSSIAVLQAARADASWPVRLNVELALRKIREQ